MKISNVKVYYFLLMLILVVDVPANVISAPCQTSKTLFESLQCIKEKEPAFIDSLNGDDEASLLKESAYRLLNPEFQFNFLNGKTVGDTQRQMTASLLFEFELGGKGKARETALDAEGLILKAEAFEQQIQSLTELGGALLRLNQLTREKNVLAESSNTFKKVIRLYSGRGQLPPEQKVSLNAFELITLDYDRRILLVDAELIKVKMRTEKLFGESSKGKPLDTQKMNADLKLAFKNYKSWIFQTPEMLRLQSDQKKLDGDIALARSELWPNLKIGPSISQVIDGPFSYQMIGFNASMPLPIFFTNGSLRDSKALTSKRIQSKIKWESQDIEAKYLSVLSQLEKISKTLADAENKEDSIQKKHASTDSLFERGLVSGAMVIEAHRSIVDYYVTKHELEKQFLEDYTKIEILSKKGIAE